MTRFARAKGSKSSNERIPLESTPWEVMKQQLEVALEKEKNQEPQTKTKSAKQLLNEKEDLYYATSLGNVGSDWAEFENSKNKANTVKNGTVEKKHKDEKKKLKKAVKKSIQAGNLENGTNVIIEDSQKPVNKKESKKTKEKKIKVSDNSVLTDEAESGKKIKKKNKNKNESTLQKIDSKKTKEKKFKYKQNDVTVETELNESMEKKLKRKNDNAVAETDSNQFKEKKRKKQEKQSKKSSEVENNATDTTSVTVANTDTNQFKEKKRKKKEKQSKKSSEEANNITETTTDDSPKSEALLKSGTKISKRQKRNQKKQIQKHEKEGGKAHNDLFNTEGNDWNNSVNFSNRKSKDNTAPAPDKFGEKREKRRFNSLEEKNLYRFGKNVPKKFQPKTAKVRDHEEYKRRKPELNSTKMTINGMDVEIVKYDGFPIRKEDAERLTDLRKEMVLKGIPKPEINAAMKLERRKCEKALARIRKQVCFHCRRAGHNLSDCPELGKEQAGTGICFKCGSTEHTHFECKVNKSDDFRYAKCFICREQGHIAKQCPDNPKGLYPDGGSCKICGDVTHLKKDCPDLVKEKEETTITLDTINDTNLESIDGETNKVKKEIKTLKKIVKF